MSRAVLLFVVLLYVYSFQAQTVALPTKSGWVIHKSGTQKPISEPVLYIGVYDEYDYAPFTGFREMGVIDHNGTVLYRAKAKIQALDFGFFLVGENLLLHVHQGAIEEQEFNIIENREQWIHGELNGNIVLINKPSGMVIPLDTKRFKVVDNHAFVSEAFHNSLYAPNGQLLDTTRFMSSNAFEDFPSYCSELKHPSGDALLWFSPRKKMILQDGKTVDLGKSKRVVVFKNHLEVVENNRVSLYDLRRKKFTMTFAGEMLRPVGNDYLIFKANNKTGLLNASGKILIPAEFDEITMFKNYILVKKGRLSGLYDNEFKKVMDCNYTLIEPRYNFYFTQKFGGRGLVSRKTNQEILAPVYDQILIQGNKIKAWLGTQLRIFVIDDGHKILEEFVVNDVISVDKSTYIDARIDYDPRLHQIGWFHISRHVKNEDGTMIHRLLWGLKDEHDSVILNPKYARLRYVHDAPVTFYPLPEVEKKTYRYSFGAVSNTTGSVVPNLVIVDIDTNDFKYRKYARFSAPDERYGILKSNGEFKHYMYVDRGDEPIVRVCKRAEIIPLDRNHTGINYEPIINLDLNNSMTFLGRKFDKKFCSQLYFRDAQWNFINSEGDPIFQDDFDYAFPFVGRHAIVKAKTGYGVVDSIGYVIAPEYGNITRVFFNGDTLFLVEQKPQGATLFQFEFGVLKNLNIHNVQVQKKREMVTMLASANKRHVVLEELGLLQDSLSNVKLHQHGFFVEKIKKQYFIFDFEGNLLCETSLRPKSVLNENLFMFQDKGLLALCDMNGDFVSELKYTSIEQAGAFILGNARGVVDVFNENGQQLFAHLDQVHVDPISGKIFCGKSGKFYVADNQGKLLQKIKTKEVVVTFIDDKIYCRNSKVISALNGSFIVSPFGTFEEIEYLGYDVVSVKRRHAYQVLYDLSGTPIPVNKDKLKRPKVLSDEVIQFHSSGKIWLYHRENESLMTVEEVIGAFQDSLLCVRFNELEYGYLDKELQNPFNTTYLKAKPFRGGMAAVQFESGWGIISSQGYLAITPCLSEIAVLSSDLVLSMAHTQLGVFDSRGKEIIPCEYDLIIIKKDYVRTHSYGKIHIWNNKFQRILESDIFGLAH